MNKEISKLKKIDERLVNNLITENQKICYYIYFADIDENKFYFQNIINDLVDYKKFLTHENKIISLVNWLYQGENGIVNTTIHTSKIPKKNMKSAKCNYHKKIKQIYKNGKANKTILVPFQKINTFSIIGTRGIGTTRFLYKKLNMILLIDDLRGVAIFENDNSIKAVMDKCKELGMTMRIKEDKEENQWRNIFIKLFNIRCDFRSEDVCTMICNVKEQIMDIAYKDEINNENILFIHKILNNAVKKIRLHKLKSAYMEIYVAENIAEDIYDNIGIDLHQYKKFLSIYL